MNKESGADIIIPLGTIRIDNPQEECWECYRNIPLAAYPHALHLMHWQRWLQICFTSIHVQYSLSETTRVHDLSTRKMHLIRRNRRTAVPTNRTIRTIRESLLRLVSIACYSGSYYVAYFCQPEKCIFLNDTVAQLSPWIDRPARFVKRFYDPCRFENCMLLPIYMPVNVCCVVVQFVNKHEHCSSEPALTNK